MVSVGQVEGRQPPIQSWLASWSRKIKKKKRKITNKIREDEKRIKREKLLIFILRKLRVFP